MRQATKAEVKKQLKALAEIRKALAKSHHDTMIRNGYQVCDECGGEGEAEYERAVVDWNNGGWLEAYTDVCDVCEGEGYVEADIEEEE